MGALTFEELVLLDAVASLRIFICHASLEPFPSLPISTHLTPLFRIILSCLGVQCCYIVASLGRPSSVIVLACLRVCGSVVLVIL